MCEGLLGIREDEFILGMRNTQCKLQGTEFHSTSGGDTLKGGAWLPCFYLCER